MISFIVIGRNEGFKLDICFSSIFKAIKQNSLLFYEIIYVDSKSTDRSILIAKSYTGIKVYQITGEYNAAIARNIGAEESIGDILFFIDGDMEIESIFLTKVLDDNKELKYDRVSGHLDDVLYDSNWIKKGVVSNTYDTSLPKKEQIVSFNGGIFLIRRKYWESVGGMKTKYKRNQDIDLSARLANKGILLVRIPHIIALHHTIDYRNSNRMWKMLFSGHLFYTSMAARDHFFNIKKTLHTLRRQYTAIFLLLSASVMVINFYYSIIFYFIYLLAIIFRVSKTTKKVSVQANNEILFFLENLLFRFVQDIVFWIGLLFFYPTSPKTQYKQIN